MDNALFGHQASLSSSRLYRPIAKRGKGFAYAPMGKIAVRTEKLTYSISRIIQQRVGKLSPDDAVPASFREHKHSSRICMLAIAAQSEAAETAKSRIKSIYVKHETRSKAWRRPVFLGRSQSPRHANSFTAATRPTKSAGESSDSSQPQDVLGTAAKKY